MTHILLAVTGMSPQVVTETLYGMAKQDLPWPDEIRLITTARGESSLRAGLFEAGHLAALCRELGKPTINEDNVSVLVVPGADGSAVEDARTVEDHEALADFIMDTVRELTADPDSVVHASIAGGRKTMTFYLGYAMSLFGRAWDRMSHVLISEGYEGLPDFYYPTHESRMIQSRDGRELDAREAHVSLADIPFIRQRDQLPTLLREPASGEQVPVRFRTLVDLINLGMRPKDIHLELHDTERCLRVFDGQRLLGIVPFTSLFDWCWLRVVVEATCNGDPSLKRREGDEGLAQERGWRVMEQLGSALGLAVDRQQDYRQQLDAWLTHHEQQLEAAGIRPADFASSMRRGLDVSAVTNRVNERLAQCLPDNLAEYLKIKIYFHPQTGQHLGELNQHPRGGGYAINLRPEQVRLLR